jgi:hypothetical protein
LDQCHGRHNADREIACCYETRHECCRYRNTACVIDQDVGIG